MHDVIEAKLDRSSSISVIQQRYDLKKVQEGVSTDLNSLH